MIFAVELDLGTSVLREEHGVAGLNVEREYLPVLALPGSYGHHFPLLWFLLRGVGNDDPPLLRSSSAIRLTMMRS